MGKLVEAGEKRRIQRKAGICKGERWMQGKFGGCRGKQVDEGDISWVKRKTGGCR